MLSIIQVHDSCESDRDISLLANRSIKWWIVLSFAFAAASAAIFLGEREPTSKEISLAYRAYLGAAQGEVRLEKQACEKLADGQYRCWAIVSKDGQPMAAPLATVEAIYSRDTKAWRFTPTGTKPH